VARWTPDSVVQARQFHRAFGRRIDWIRRYERICVRDGELRTSGRHVLPPPPNLNTMVDYATTLAADLPFVRADFYDLVARVVFGELTWYPDAACVLLARDVRCGVRPMSIA